MVGEPSQTSGSAGAVFLSYASEDVGAAERIATALRSAGIEVWFDREELRGGDVWDRRIREQIHGCRLFMPIISSHTEARIEGYFRREWKLAVDRTHDLSERVAFLIPAVIDSTTEQKADVPDAFRRVQWTRLLSEQIPAAFVDRVRQLLSPETSSTRTPATPATPRSTPVQRPWSLPPLVWRYRVAMWAIGVALIVALSYFTAERFWLSKHTTTATVTTAVPARAPSENSIAVLPFTDLSEKRDQEYFGTDCPRRSSIFSQESPT
jgi:hypothetical protein